MNLQLLAALAQGTVKPKYEVEELPEDHIVERRAFRYVTEESGGKTIQTREEYVKEIHGGFMLYTSKGDSLFVATKEELKRLGCAGTPSLVHEGGEELDLPEPPSLKTQVAMRTGFRVRADVN